ncbi:MAG: nickel pincer cofactor biosynthesis protein LarB [Acidimicrobiales bacterium]
MDEAQLRALIDGIRVGEVAPDDAVAELRRLPFADIGAARVDHHRTIRQGLPEAVYGPGKSPEHCVAIVGELLTNGVGPVLVTRVSETQRKALESEHPGSDLLGDVMSWRSNPTEPGRSVAVLTAGTADAAVADECEATLRSYGAAVDRLDDVGVAGIHRLLGELDRVTSAHVVIVVAGMEGALASVVGGVCAAPVIAVPTSVGYGAGLDGVTALLGMLASCAAGVSVVGIDNGYGAAVGAMRILRAMS